MWLLGLRDVSVYKLWGGKQTGGSTYVAVG